jgi:putative tricarboxylic transport membrane protein
MNVADLGLLAGALTLANLLYALIGCLLGTIVGILPGLGPASAMAILLPFVFYLPPEASIIIMAGIYYGAMYGGSTTAILMNIPGEVSSAVTAIDGFAMTKQGRAGQALAIAAIGSFVAGILGTAAIALLGPQVAGLAMRFGPPEYFGLVVFSMTALVSFAGRSLLIGLSMGLLGIWLGALGTDPLTGVQRLTFGSVELMKGFDIIPVLVGLFGIGEVLVNVHQRVGQLYSGRLGAWHTMVPRGLELRRGLAASARGTAVGAVLGVLPGMLPALTAFLAYDLEKRISPRRSEFGNGAIEGVAAPEAANNATAMTGFIPLLSLGIPTSPALAIMLGVLIINGLQPGPTLFSQHADFAFVIVGSMLISNLMLLVLNLPLLSLWARISMVPYKLLAPFVLAFCFVGAYAPRNTMTDVWIAVLFGVLGYLMRRVDWPMAPLVLGLLMGPLVERSLRQSLGMSGGALDVFYARPITAAFLLASVAAIIVIALLKMRSKAISGIVDESVNEM